VACFVIFSLLLLITRNLGVAAMAMGIVGVIATVLVSFPLAYLETDPSRGIDLKSLGQLFAACFPAFLALFMYQLIDNMPKFLMEGMLTYDNQLYFNALYFPAMAILLIVGFLYKPLLGRMADTWNDFSRRRRFDLFLIVAMLIIIAITALAVGIMHTIGIPIMSFLYGVDFEPYRHFSYLMIVAGGFAGAIDFLYQVMTVMRRQGVVPKLYFITLIFSVVIPWMLIRVSGLRGAIMGYLIVMAILFVLLALEYISVRVQYGKHPEDDPTFIKAQRDAERAAADQLEAPASQSLRPRNDPGSTSPITAQVLSVDDATFDAQVTQVPSPVQRPASSGSADSSEDFYE